VTHGEFEDAKRRAFQIFDDWVQVTGIVPVGSSYYYEMQDVIEDAVHCGAQSASGDFKRLEAEEEFKSIPGWRESPKSSG
jgi:hypothetical protein